MGSIFSTSKSREEIQMALEKAKQIVASNPVFVFSKTYCGYCQRVKQLFSQLQTTYKVIELDEESDGDEIQSALAEWTGQRTVPNVFIDGKHIGGSDVVLEKHEKGTLFPCCLKLVQYQKTLLSCKYVHWYQNNMFMLY